MKTKAAANFFIATLILISIFLASHYTHYYNRENCVVVGKCDGELTLKDATGNYWFWYAEDQEEWDFYINTKESDIVTLKMFDNYSENNIFDDVITEIERG